MVKPTLEPLSCQSENTLLVRIFEQDEFHSPYHFHPEIELTAILKGEGNRFVGNNMSAYGTNDLVLIGPNLPHCWKNTSRGETINARSVVVQFDKSLFGDGFFEKHQAWHIVHLLLTSQQGIHFSGPENQQVIDHMLDMASAGTPYKKLILLLEVLDILAASQNRTLLNDELVVSSAALHHYHRLNAVQGFIIDNFRTKVTLQEIAGLARMSTNAFCKYYKKTTGRTATEAVMAYRLKYARQQLLSTNKTVAEICFDSGFTDMAFFYKTFRAHMGRSPGNYRKEYIKNLNPDEPTF
ncbi:Cupin domain-containing protein [Dyadobacter soli]|uniref:Cupin domain-containing protein n=2 Tax=Dyadobacter soli TaxID=659014 RepID=A0A1G6VP93_9BACT|nr:Cupin domain-containing protein [Dyadobacter soli]